MEGTNSIPEAIPTGSLFKNHVSQDLMAQGKESLDRDDTKGSV
jgi:hypothetical protein